jgi:hypothetical protein
MHKNDIYMTRLIILQLLKVQPAPVKKFGKVWKETHTQTHPQPTDCETNQNNSSWITAPTE